MLPTQAVYKMLDNENLWDTAARCHAALAAADIPHAIVGGVAVCLHGYQRNTVDLDLLIDPDDSTRVRESLTSIDLIWNEEAKEFRTAHGIPVQFLLKGDRAGNDSAVRLPDPADENSITQIDGLPVLSLAKLIDAKIACGEGNLRRTHKDFADVVELIAVHELNSSFARFLHKSVRKQFRQLVKRAKSE